MYNFLSKFLKLTLNFMFLIQIILMLLVFFTAAYWFFSLIHSNLFAFAAPLADGISDIIRVFYDHETVIGGVQVDATLLLFNVIAICFVIIVSKLKYYIYRALEKTDYIIMQQYKKAEEQLNEELQREAEDYVKRYKNAVIVIEFDARNMRVDNIWGGDKTKGVDNKINEAIKIFYSTAKSFKNCKFAKTENRIAIMIDDFDKFDYIMVSTEQILDRIKQNMSKINWEFISYIVADVYYDNTDFKCDVYPRIKKLLNLKFKNNILCYGNFRLRYDLLPQTCYYIVERKGDYKIDGITGLYNLVKKN